MAWDTEGTRRRLLEAAVEEFSRYGFAGARVDRIATAAKVNKERIYQYFGGKEELFGAVLERELAAAMDAVPIEGHGIDAVTDYAGRLFDYQIRHPHLARLTFWEGLERRSPFAAEARSVRLRSKIGYVGTALPQLAEDEAQDLLLTIVTLADGYQALPNLDSLYTGKLEPDAARLARRRGAIVSTVRATVESLLAARASA